ncbi:MAG: thiamine diphosphokinase [Pseudomonadota bacterium]
MFRLIQSPHEAVTLVGAGDATIELLKIALTHAPVLVAADGGARLALEAGVMPRAVIGDFDSSGDLDLPKEVRIVQPDQNSTDFDKCLRAIDAPLFIGVGFLGGRLDHQLASLTTLLGDQRPIVLISAHELAFIAPRDIEIELPDGSPCAFYPLIAARLTTCGVEYPLSDADVAPEGLISTSNSVSGGRVRIATDRHGVLVTLPIAALPAVLRALGR